MRVAIINPMLHMYISRENLKVYTATPEQKGFVWIPTQVVQVRRKWCKCEGSGASAKKVVQVRRK
jgi:hypothetical protein